MSNQFPVHILLQDGMGFDGYDRGRTWRYGILVVLLMRMRLFSFVTEAIMMATGAWEIRRGFDAISA